MFFPRSTLHKTFDLLLIASNSARRKGFDSNLISSSITRDSVPCSNRHQDGPKRSKPEEARASKRHRKEEREKDREKRSKRHRKEERKRKQLELQRDLLRQRSEEVQRDLHRNSDQALSRLVHHSLPNTPLNSGPYSLACSLLQGRAVSDMSIRAMIP
jgi:hypothetical protein